MLEHLSANKISFPCSGKSLYVVSVENYILKCDVALNVMSISKRKGIIQ